MINEMDTLVRIKTLCNNIIIIHHAELDKEDEEKEFTNGLVTLSKKILSVIEEYENYNGEIWTNNNLKVQQLAQKDYAPKEIINVKIDRLRQKVRDEYNNLNPQDKDFYKPYHIEDIATGINENKFYGIMFYNDDISLDLNVEDTQRLCNDFEEDRLTNEDLMLKYKLNYVDLQRMKYTWAFNYFDEIFKKYDEDYNAKIEKYTNMDNIKIDSIEDFKKLATDNPLIFTMLTSDYGKFPKNPRALMEFIESIKKEEKEVEIEIESYNTEEANKKILNGLGNTGTFYDLDMINKILNTPTSEEEKKSLEHAKKVFEETEFIGNDEDEKKDNESE